jgi:hypothetical protein
VACTGVGGAVSDGDGVNLVFGDSAEVVWVALSFVGASCTCGGAPPGCNWEDFRNSFFDSA